MNICKNYLKFIIGFIFIVTQIILGRNYLPFLPNKIIVKGQRCTCPHASVQQGESYLKKISPDSLKKFKLDYTEIYFETEISTSSDPMGVESYVLTGKIIGKKSISNGDKHYYPIFRIDTHENIILHNIISVIMVSLLIFELFVFYRILSST